MDVETLPEESKTAKDFMGVPRLARFLEVRVRRVPIFVAILAGFSLLAAAGSTIALTSTQSSVAATANVDRLIEQARSKEPRTRWEAVKALAESGDSSKVVVSTIIAALKDKDARARLMAAASLGRLAASPESTGPALIQALDDDEPAVRAQATTALGELGTKWPSLTQFLIDVLKDGSERARIGAARTLEMLRPRPERALPALVEGLRDGNAEVRHEIARTAGMIGSQGDAPSPLLLQSLEARDWEVREGAARAFQVMGPFAAPAVVALARLLNDAEPTVREAAAGALQAVGEEAYPAVPQLTTTLRDAVPEVRRRVVASLAAIGDQALAAVPTLAELLRSDRDPTVRRRAAEALGKIKSNAEEAIPALAAATKDQELPVRLKALEALGSVIYAFELKWMVDRALDRGKPESSEREVLQSAAVSALRDALADQNPKVRGAAATAAGAIGPNANAASAFVPYLSKAAGDADPKVRASSIQALGLLGAAAVEALPVLTERLREDDSTDVRVSALYALTSVTAARPEQQEQALLSLLRASEDADQKVRDVAKSILSVGTSFSLPVPATRLAEFLSDTRPIVRAWAARRLGVQGAEGKAATPALARALHDSDKIVRWSAADALAAIGGVEASEASPVLMEQLGDPGLMANLQAARAFAAMGTRATHAVPLLVQKLEYWIDAAEMDSNGFTRAELVNALGAVGPESVPAVPTLRRLLSAEPGNVRYNAVRALGEIGARADAAVPELIESLNDAALRETAQSALGKIGDQVPAAVVPKLAEALHHDHSDVRVGALNVLATLGRKAGSTTSAIVRLLSDETATVRRAAVTTLGAMGEKARDAAPQLALLLNDSDPTVRDAACRALPEIDAPPEVTLPAVVAAFARERERATAQACADAITRLAEAVAASAGEQSSAQLKHSLASIKSSLTTVNSASAFEDLQQKAKTSLSRSARILASVLQSRWPQLMARLSENKPAFAAVLLVLLYCMLALVCAAILWVRPLWLLWLNDQLLAGVDVELGGSYGKLRLPIRKLLVVGLVAYRGRVLDAWIGRNVDQVRSAFERQDTVKRRQIHIATPVVLDGVTLASVNPQDLRRTFFKERSCLLIEGEGGSGKTSLACQVAKWLMSPDPSVRPCPHRVLPVLIDHDLKLDERIAGTAFQELVRGQLQSLVEAREAVSVEFLERLLRLGRVVVIFDGLSEWSDEMRALVRPDLPGFPASAIIVTARTRNVLSDVPLTVLMPLRIDAKRLSPFIDAYLRRREKREEFNDVEFFAACTHLSTIASNASITVLLVKLYAELLIAKHDAAEEGDMPSNVPEIIVGYLSEINRHSGAGDFDNRAVRKIAKIVAWECVRRTYRPVAAERAVVIQALASDDAGRQLQYLEERLQLIETIKPMEDRIRFTLDPLVEYLGAMHAVDLHGADGEQWAEFLRSLRNSSASGNEIGGFLQALTDCCTVAASESRIPEWVSGEVSVMLQDASAHRL